MAGEAVVNQPVRDAVQKAKASPVPASAWDVVRQLGQGMLTIANVGAAPQPSTSPTSLPAGLTPQAVLALGSEKGPVLAAFTTSNVAGLLPAGGPRQISEQLVPAVEVARLVAAGSYAGLAVDPGTEHGYVIPAEFLKAGLPGGRTNARAKTLLQGGNLDEEGRKALLQALAAGPIYTPAEKAALDAGNATKFPLVPLGGPIQPGEVPPETAAAVVFGTSPAEIAAMFNPEQWVPVPVRMNDVVQLVRKSAPVKLAVINPLGPTLQLPISPAPADGAASADGSEPSDSSAAPVVADMGELGAAPKPSDAEFGAALAALLAEPTPPEGSSTEPDAGTREGLE